jgi:hypothetical protein
MTVAALETLAQELATLKERGHTAVAMNALLPYVTGLLASARSGDPEGERQRVKINFEGQVEAYRAEVSSQLELLKAAIEAGQSALKSISVINGAAALAMLAFIGNVLSHPTDIGLAAMMIMSRSMTYFATGVGLSAIGLAARYFSQASYAGDFSNQSRATKWGNTWRVIAIVAGVAGLAAFFIGVRVASRAVGLSI